MRMIKISKETVLEHGIVNFWTRVNKMPIFGYIFLSTKNNRQYIWQLYDPKVFKKYKMVLASTNFLIIFKYLNYQYFAFYS